MSSIKWGEWSANGHWVCVLFMKWTKIFSGEKNSFETTAINRKKEEHLPNSVIKLRGNLLGRQQQQQGPIECDPFTARPILNPLNISTLIRTFVFRTDNCQPIRKTFIILSENVLCRSSINMPIFNEGQFVPSFLFLPSCFAFDGKKAVQSKNFRFVSFAFRSNIWHLPLLKSISTQNKLKPKPNSARNNH